MTSSYVPRYKRCNLPSRRDTSVLSHEITDLLSAEICESRRVKVQRTKRVLRCQSVYAAYETSISCYCSLPAASPGKLGYCAIKQEGLLDYIRVECDLSAGFNSFKKNPMLFMRALKMVSSDHFRDSARGGIVLLRFIPI